MDNFIHSSVQYMLKHNVGTDISIKNTDQM